MRLYFKLMVIVLIAATIQSRAPGGTDRSELWFALRCQIAHLTNDTAMTERLIEEEYQILRRQHEQPVFYANAGAPAAAE